MTNDWARLGRVLMSEVTSTSVEWLWPGRIPRRKLTLLEGDPGTGKSTLTLQIAARVSVGEPLPGGSATEPQGVVLWSAEDDLGDTVAPRLLAAGADLNQIVAREFVMGDQWGRRPPTLDDLQNLADDIESVRAGIVFIDPMVAFLPSGTNPYSDMQVRQALSGIDTLARDTGAAIVLIRHLHKRATGNPIYAGGGSIGFAAAARSVLLCAKDPDDPTGTRRVLARSKSNLAAEVPSLAFRIEAAGDASLVIWEGESQHTAASLLQEPMARPTGMRKFDQARAFLRELLGEGRLRSAEVLEEAARRGFSETMVRRAQEAEGIEPQRTGFGAGSAVYWELPDEGTSP